MRGFARDALLDPSLYFWAIVVGIPYAAALVAYTAVFMWLRWRAALHLFAWILPIQAGVALVLVHVSVY